MDERILEELKQINNNLVMLTKILSRSEAAQHGKNNLSNTSTQKDISSEVRMKIEEAKRNADSYFSKRTSGALLSRPHELKPI